MRAWFSARFPSLAAVLSGASCGLAIAVLSAALAVPAWSAATAAPRMIRAALTSPAGASAVDRCEGADPQALHRPLLAGRIGAPEGEGLRGHASPRQPTLNRAVPANDDLRRFSRAF